MMNRRSGSGGGEMWNLAGGIRNNALLNLRRLGGYVHAKFEDSEVVRLSRNKLSLPGYRKRELRRPPECRLQFTRAGTDSGL